MNTKIKDAYRALLTVGEYGGRGFVVEALNGDRYVITAAHCLPGMPLPHPWASETRIWRVLAALSKKPNVFAECFFVDPVADIAVLAASDTEDLSQQCEDLLKKFAALPLGRLEPKQAELKAWLLGLDGTPICCRAQYWGDGPLWVFADKPIVGGMSGSPILADNGTVIGVCSCSNNGNQGGPMPRPDAALSVRYLQRIGTRAVRSRLMLTAAKL